MTSFISSISGGHACCCCGPKLHDPGGALRPGATVRPMQLQVWMSGLLRATGRHIGSVHVLASVAQAVHAASVDDVL